MEAERNQLPPVEDGPARWPWVVGGIAALLAWWVWSTSNDPAQQEKARARDAIAACWQDQGRKSLAPDAQRLVAGACEQMEAAFTSKYGVRP
jgi:hypothetical protein